MIGVVFLCVRFALEQTVYRISDQSNPVEICVNSDLPGISAEFQIFVKIGIQTSELNT